jgi:hypothetical protein
MTISPLHDAGSLGELLRAEPLPFDAIVHSP